MPHWSCSSVLCYNNHLSKDENGVKMGKYKLPTDIDTQAAYARFFKTTKTFNWKKGYICAAHWSTGVRESPQQLPDVLLPPGHFDILELKYSRAKQTLKSAAKPNFVQRRAFKKAKAKFRAAKSLTQQSTKVPIRRRAPKSRGSSSSTTNSVAPPPPPTSSSSSIPQPASPIVSSTVSPTEDVNVLRQLLAEKDAKIDELEDKINKKNKRIDELKVEAHERSLFTFEEISKDPENLEYLTGLSLEQFSLMMECVTPYIESSLRYDGDRKPSQRTFSYNTQYLIVMMICRHSLDFKFAAFMTKVSSVTIGRYFNAWVIFL